MQPSWIKTGMFDVRFNLAYPWISRVLIIFACSWSVLGTEQHLTEETESDITKKKRIKDRCAQTRFAPRHSLLRWKGRNWEEQLHFPRTVSGVFYVVFVTVCVFSNDGHLEGFDLCVVREVAFVGAGVSEVRFSSGTFYLRRQTSVWSSWMWMSTSGCETEQIK